MKVQTLENSSKATIRSDSKTSPQTTRPSSITPKKTKVIIFSLRESASKHEGNRLGGYENEDGDGIMRRWYRRECDQIDL